MKQLLEPLRIESLANGGSGIARLDGRVIFVPGTAPGDLVRCRLVRDKRRYAEAEVVDLIEVAGSRRPAPCPVAAECGGCQWQHLPYADQLRWKEQLFHDSLLRQCGVEQQRLLPIIPAPREWGYRSRAQVKCFRAAQGFVTGFFRAQSHYVVPMRNCPVLAPELNELLAGLRDLLGSTDFAAEIPQIDLALGDDRKRRAVVHYLGRQAGQLAELLRPLAAAGKSDLLLQVGRQESLTALAGDGELTIKVGRPLLKLRCQAGGFTQINLEQNRRLVERVVAAARLTGAERVLDLFCGMGNFSLPLARLGGLVVGVEAYSASIAMARENAAANGIGNVEFHARPAEGALTDFSSRQPFDLLLLDPPRSGAYEVMKELLRQPVKRVLYVSCDPQTLTRDLKPLLNNGYQLETSQPLDMFPQTFHCESLTILKYLS
jgi:23S rRNA (uracil1939-C5)-methyltransferase